MADKSITVTPLTMEIYAQLHPVFFKHVQSYKSDIGNDMSFLIQWQDLLEESRQGSTSRLFYSVGECGSHIGVCDVAKGKVPVWLREGHSTYRAYEHYTLDFDDRGRPRLRSMTLDEILEIAGNVSVSLSLA